MTEKAGQDKGDRHDLPTLLPSPKPRVCAREKVANAALDAASRSQIIRIKRNKFSMKDNWNILAKLLDTPGASDPPADEDKQSKSDVSTEPAKSSIDAIPAGASEEHDADKNAETKNVEPKASKSGSILDALKAKIPPQILPGFGSSNDDDAEPAKATDSLTAASDASGSEPVTEPGNEVPNSDSESAPAEGTDNTSADAEVEDNLGGWSDLASELGIEEVPEPQQAVAHEPQADRSDSETKPKSKREKRSHSRKKTTGFAKGLGFEDDEDQSDQIQAELDSEDESFDDPLASPSAFGDMKETSKAADRPEQAHRRERGDDREDGRARRRSPRERRERDTQEGEKSQSRFDTPQSRTETEASSRADGRGKHRGNAQENSDEIGDSKSRGRRGRRRGTRQQISEAELDRLDEGEASHTRQADSHDEDQRPRRRRGRRSEQSPDASMDSRNEKRGRQQRDDDTENEDNEFGDFGADIRSETKDVSSDEDAPRSRSRRRGRRGRGRGRERAEQNNRDQDTDTLDNSDTQDDPLLSTSAFGDDQDDRSQNRRGRRGDRTRDRGESSDKRENSRGRSSSRSRNDDSIRNDDDEPRARRGRGNRSREDASDDEPRRKRSNVPTWLETVELLVEANIENHKNSKSGKNSGGRGRGGGRRR